MISACQAAETPTPGLTLEEYPLESPPDSDAGIFLPVGTSQEAVLAKHQDQREQTVYNQTLLTPGSPYPSMASLGPGQSLEAALGVSADNPLMQTVELLQDDQILFNVDAGLPSPALPLQSLWSYGDHWVLEIVYAEEEIWEGRIYQDGQFLNDTLNYQEAFGFQLLAGKPFYFFQREDGLGYSYDGEETSLPYNEIPHYNCCSASTLNPIPAENMVAFYALTGDQWYYIELGDYSLEP
jgi:hypothetical protein